MWPESLSRGELASFAGFAACAPQNRIPSASRGTETRISLASFIVLIPQRLSGLEGEGDALLSFALAAEGDEGLALEVQQILLADESACSDPAAAENVGRPSRDLLIVLGSVACLAHQENSRFERGQRRCAGCGNACA